MNKPQLIRKIEQARSRMILATIRESLTSRHVQHLSRRLDQLLNKYDHLTK
ncbi:aspartyl-phosphate phosphatase Spo0E family protein [Sporolactobacillus sp. THM19-2]|uniref:aspartyl-phosphate phosphatase Spo0E family protein n=1 Tax=Sporolactobacillus sp. THM19-2 TaxID=2511171 RepID=UPI00102067EB|nr:aspartyl-phosphate phosphatase Spo0E family protein [Sporolactobacillus sp. THM19-2]RYL88096.1 aspartyl-phosphate phosphatase Spo0E family protein [Sporolactobacillus sp. THM19-2]